MILNKIKALLRNISESYKEELKKIQIKDAENLEKINAEYVEKNFNEDKVLEAAKSYVESKTVPVKIPGYELVITSSSGSVIEIHTMDYIDSKVLKIIRKQIKNGYKFYITPTNGMIAESMQNNMWVKVSVQLDVSQKIPLEHIHLEQTISK